MRQKIAQLFICKNPDDKEEIEEFINQGIGGFMIGKGGEIVSHEQAELEGDSKASLKQFTSYLRKTSKELNKLPLFLAIDGEGGDYFNRLMNVSELKNQRFYGLRYEKDKNTRAYELAVKKFAKLMNELNLNMNFAPLLDRALPGYKGYTAEERILIKKRDDADLTNSECCASARAYSDKIETVTALGSVAVKVFQEHDIICTVKHFPSYGILKNEENPHLVLPKINMSEKELMNELKPHKKVFSEGCYSLMKGHVIFNCLDKEVPVTLSKKADMFLKDRLNFKGLVVVDELNMNAITQFYGKENPEKAAVDAVWVNDIILISHPETFILMLDAIEKAAEKDPKLKARIEEAYDKVIEYKKKINLISS